VALGYDLNIEGALAVLVDLMQGNGFTMSRSPYAPNYRGLVDALIDLKESFPTVIPYRVGFDAVTFENVTQGDVLYLRNSDGLVGRAIASGTLDEAYVVGFADTTKLAGETVRVLVTGVEAMSGLDAGDHYFLSAGGAGAITTTPPSATGQYVVRVGEAVSGSEIAIQLEPPILLS
jgi:hypothetical protein